MQTKVMRYYGLARPPVDRGLFEPEHHAQLTHNLKTAITGGRLIALTATIGSGTDGARFDGRMLRDVVIKNNTAFDLLASTTYRCQ